MKKLKREFQEVEKIRMQAFHHIDHKLNLRSGNSCNSVSEESNDTNLATSETNNTTPINASGDTTQHTHKTQIQNPPNLNKIFKTWQDKLFGFAIFIEGTRLTESKRIKSNLSAFEKFKLEPLNNLLHVKAGGYTMMQQILDFKSWVEGLCSFFQTAS